MPCFRPFPVTDESDRTRVCGRRMAIVRRCTRTLVGAFLLLWLLGYHLSVAVWVGIIALAGVDAEMGMVMLLYLDIAYERWKREGRVNGIADLESAVME